MLNKGGTRGRQSGLSLVELLVGAAIGLFLVGGATKLFIDTLDDSRRLIIETRVNQDLRAASDLVARDLRRAGYWPNALQAAVQPPGVLNPYSTASVAPGQVLYAYARDGDNALNATTEQLGFQLDGNVIRVLNGGTWQQVTDPQSVVVTQFSISPITRLEPAGHLCPTPCAAGTAGCPAVAVRRYDIVMTGHAPNDTSVVRQISESVRLRNDEVQPASCP
jgi:prepilin peptidase dependent protein B